MALKSARAAASLRIAHFRRRNAPNDAGAAVHLHRITVLEPARDAWERHDGGNPSLARDEGRMGEQTAAFDEQASRRGEHHDPSRVGVLRDEDRALLEIRCRRIGHDANRSANEAGRATEALPLVTGWHPGIIRAPKIV